MYHLTSFVLPSEIHDGYLHFPLFESFSFLHFVFYTKKFVKVDLPFQILYMIPLKRYDTEDPKSLLFT